MTTLVLDTLRWLTCKALDGRTWAGSRVYDSPSQPGDIRAQIEPQPFIGVYVDDADFDFGDCPGMMLPDKQDIRLVIEVGVVSAKKFDAQGNALDPAADVPVNGWTVTQINATDPGLEAQLGFISRQVQQALLSTQETAPWSELWRLFTMAGQISKIEIRRGGPGDTEDMPKTRYASRIMIFHLSTLAEPVRGSDLDLMEFWTMLIEAFEGDADVGYRSLGQLLRAHIVSPSGPLPEWREAQKLMVAPRDTIRALGIAPADILSGEAAGGIEQPPLATRVTTRNLEGGQEVVIEDGPTDVP